MQLILVQHPPPLPPAPPGRLIPPPPPPRPRGEGPRGPARGGLAVTAVDPQTVRDHPLPKRLDARAQAVTRGELLRRERGAEIGIVLPDQRQNGAPECLAMSAIARATAFAGNQARCAIDGEGTTQPENLAPAQTHQRRGGLDCEPAVCQVDHDTKPGQFLTAHLDHRHRTSPRTSRRQPASVTSLSGTRVTFLSVTYTPR